MPDLDALSSLERYTAVSERAAAEVIAGYSTSFSAATKLLGKQHKRHIRNIYALVRVADEVVDGVTEQAGLPFEQRLHEISELEQETLNAVQTGYSSNLVVHAFATTARQVGITEREIVPFFDSMRSDLQADTQEDASVADTHSQQRVLNPTDHARYVYGSAEVVGLMCLRVFIHNVNLTSTEIATVESGARSLGAAFQNVNFLRDLGDDQDRLGRSYLGTDVMLASTKDAWVQTISEQLADAAKTIPLLPADARVGVNVALQFFDALLQKIERTPAAALGAQRIRVSTPQKLAIVLRSFVQRGVKKR